MASKKRKVRQWLLGTIILALLIYIGWFLNAITPVVSAYGAKYVCDAVYLQHRNPEEVIKTDLTDLPFNLGTYTVNESDSSVTGSVLGLAKRRAIYRKNAGVTLVNDIPEQTIWQQQFSKPPLPALNFDTVPWPRGDLIKKETARGIDTALLQTYLRECLHENFDDNEAGTRALIAVYDGEIIGELYAPGYNYKTVMPAWSITKSITAGLVAILTKSGHLHVNQPAPVPGWENSRKKEITIKHLLQQTSGLDYKEDYYGPNGPNEMLFKRGSAGGYATQLPQLSEPGTVFNYSSANSNILSMIIKNTVASEGYTRFPYDTLLYKIGMYSTQLEPDASGMYVGSSFCFATARDFARLGLLYYNNGNWLGQQILPGDWVAQATKAPAENLLQHHGFHLWLNGFIDTTHTKRIYPSAPPDLFYASGYNNQGIFIIPSKKLVLVRLGLRKINEDKLIAKVLSCLPE